METQRQADRQTDRQTERERERERETFQRNKTYLIYIAVISASI